MGANNSISKQSSLFKTYNPEQWQPSSLNNGQQQLWWNKRTNQHFQVYSIPKTSTIQDLQKYQLRYLHCFYLVKVFDVLRINDPQSFAISKNDNIDQKNLYKKTLQDIYENVVLIQHIVSRFSAIKWLTFQEALYSLKCIFKGCSLMHSFFGKFDIDQQMIGINQFGKVKVWINPNFDSNKIPKTSQSLQQEYNQNSNRKRTINQKRRLKNLIRKIFNLVQAKVKAPFSQHLKNEVIIKQTFGQAAQNVQKYSKDNKIYLPQYIAIRNRKNQYLSNQKTNNNNFYAKKNQTIHTTAQKSNTSDNYSRWNQFIDKKRGNTQSYINMSNKASHSQPYSITSKLQSKIEKKADSTSKYSQNYKREQFQSKRFIKNGNKYETTVNSPPRERQMSKQSNQTANYHNILSKTNKGSIDARFSLGTQITQQLQIISQLRRENKKANQHNFVITEQERRKTHQHDLFQRKNNRESIKNSQNFKNRKFPPRNVELMNKKGIQSPKRHTYTQKFINQFVPHQYYQQVNNTSFKKKKQQIPKPEETFDTHKKTHTQCVTTYSNDPSKFSTSLQTRFPINSPKKSQHQIFYFKSKKIEQTDSYMNLKNQIKQIFIEQDVFSPQSSQKVKKIVRKQSKNTSNNQRFQNYIENRRKSNQIGKGLVNKPSNILISDNQNLTGLHIQKTNFTFTNYSVGQLQQVRVSRNNQQEDDSMSHTLMQNLQNLDLEEDQQYYRLNYLIENEFQEEFSIQHGIQHTVQSSVDEMDDPEDLKNKLTRIKIQDLFKQRQKRQQNQKERKKSIQKQHDIQKQRLKNKDKINKQKTQSFKIQNKFVLDNAMDPFYNKQRQRALRQTYHHQNKNLIQGLNYDPFSKKQKANPQYFSQQNQIEQKKNEKISYITKQSRKRVKHSHDTIYDYKNIQQKDPYGIDQKYNKYVTNKSPINLKKDQQKDSNKRINVNTQIYTYNANDNKVNFQFTQKKQKKFILPDQQTQNNSLKQTRKKITYEKLKNFLQE